jgi:hypothetical protein
VRKATLYMKSKLKFNKVLFNIYLPIPITNHIVYSLQLKTRTPIRAKVMVIVISPNMYTIPLARYE